MFDEFAKNILGANKGDSGNIYQNYAASGMDASSAKYAGNQASAQASIDEQERQQAAERAKAAAAMAAEADANAKDPNKATMEMKPDHSGYFFRDGMGKELNINQFSLLTGKRPDELLADSDNPRDQKFVQDYKTMKDISSAWVNGDTATLQKYRAADPDKFNTLVSQYKKPADMVQGFMKYYSDYYGDTTGKTTANSAAFSPGNVTGPSKPEQKLLAPTSLSQTLAPRPATPAIPYSGTANLGQRLTGIAERIPGLNLLTGRQDELNRQKKKLAANPWSTYRNTMMGR